MGYATEGFKLLSGGFQSLWSFQEGKLDSEPREACWSIQISLLAFLEDWCEILALSHTMFVCSFLFW